MVMVLLVVVAMKSGTPAPSTLAEREREKRDRNIGLNPLSHMPAVIPVKYHCGPNCLDGGYVYVFEAVGPSAVHLNTNTGGAAQWGTGITPARARYFAGKGWYCYRSDCKRDARRFGAHHGVRTRTLCLPMPVKFRCAWFPMHIIQILSLIHI